MATNDANEGFDFSALKRGDNVLLRATVKSVDISYAAPASVWITNPSTWFWPPRELFHSIIPRPITVGETVKIRRFSDDYRVVGVVGEKAWLQGPARHSGPGDRLE